MKGAIIIAIYTEKMLNLYEKIRKNIATEAERIDFKVLVKSCCVDEKVLMLSLEEALKKKIR